jgi:hypothetical protein
VKNYSGEEQAPEIDEASFRYLTADTYKKPLNAFYKYIHIRDNT